MSRFDPLPGTPPAHAEESISYVEAVSALSGVNSYLILLAAQHLLGGVAGHHSWMEGAASEVIRPAFSLIVAGGDDPRWQRALELLLAPLLACQNRAREISRSCVLDVVRHEAVARQKRDGTLDLLNKEFPGSPFGEGVMVSVNRNINVLQKPLVLLDAPDLPAYVDLDAGHLCFLGPIVLERPRPQIAEHIRPLFAHRPKRRAILAIIHIFGGQNVIEIPRAIVALPKVSPGGIVVREALRQEIALGVQQELPLPENDVQETVPLLLAPGVPVVVPVSINEHASPPFLKLLRRKLQKVFFSAQKPSHVTPRVNRMDVSGFDRALQGFTQSMGR